MVNDLGECCAKRAGTLMLVWLGDGRSLVMISGKNGLVCSRWVVKGTMPLGRGGRDRGISFCFLIFLG
ncbi:hypothetical protein Hanom_Chr10g00912911 [Helianthus anomalus]